jgi:hypothetical protein
MGKSKEYNAVQTAQKVGNAAKKWVQFERKRLGSVDVYATPMNGHGTSIQLSFTGSLDTTKKETIRDFLLNGFKDEIAPILKAGLGWTKFRVNTCARHKSDTVYNWFIENR